MRRNCVVSLLAVIALSWVLAASCSVWAEPSGVNYRWGGSTPTQVVVDGEYAQEHPEQVGLQGVVVDTRTRVALVEGRVDALEQDTSNPPAENPATMNTNGNWAGGTTVNNTVYPQPYTPGATAPPAGLYPPPPPPFGGPAVNTPPAPPVKEGSGMSTGGWIGVGLLIVGVVILFVWVIPSIVEANRRNAARNKIEEVRLQMAANGLAVTNNASQRTAQTIPTMPEFGTRKELMINVSAEGTFLGYSQAEASSADSRDWWAAQNPAAANAYLSLPAAAGNPRIITASAREYGPAIASLARPSSAVRSGAPAVAAPRPLANTTANRDALANALVGEPDPLSDPFVDNIRDRLVINGQITP